MDPTIISLLISVAGAGIGAATKLLTAKAQRSRESREEDVISWVVKGAIAPERRRPPLAPGKVVLVLFSIIVLAFGAITVVRYWATISQQADNIFFATWLFLTMIGGMFVQVVSSNYRAGRALFDVTASQLTFPVLFALIVFYPVWAIGASAPHNLFSFYAAFLNGFFWETVVSGARLPTPPAANVRAPAANPAAPADA